MDRQENRLNRSKMTHLDRLLQDFGAAQHGSVQLFRFD
jgi:hypothetical protein